MKILHLAPLWFPVSPDAQGGIETYLPTLLGALERRGCRNTLLASGDSHTAAELVPVISQNLGALMDAGLAAEETYYEQHQLWLALEMAGRFDVVHSHLGWTGYVLSAVPGLGGRVLHTEHNPVYRDQEWFVGRHPDLWLSTVSEFQARKLRAHGARRCRVVPNGLDVSSFTFQARAGEGLFFLGRIEEGKGTDLAVRAARALGRPLTLAGPVIDEDFFGKEIAPSLGEQIRHVGVVNHAQKNELFGRAGCVLMPSRVEEGFGMVAVEAMACGTPVVALASGALPEVIDAGVTGYVTADEDGLAPLVAEALKLDRKAVRDRARARYDIAAVAEKYHRLYAEIAAEGGAR
jgi:glycosyltransferase involved in cell wall biosynthesis